MKTDLHLGFKGNCDEAFAFYEKVFKAKRLTTMKWGDGPMPCKDVDKDKVMHTAMPLGTITLMGADAPEGASKTFGGFDISLTTEEAEVKRLFGELSDGGSVMMPPGPTFWTSLFAMCTDKFGVSWMLSVPGHEPPQTK